MQFTSIFTATLLSLPFLTSSAHCRCFVTQSFQTEANYTPPVGHSSVTSMDVENQVFLFIPWKCMKCRKIRLHFYCCQVWVLPPFHLFTPSHIVTEKFTSVRALGNIWKCRHLPLMESKANCRGESSRRKVETAAGGGSVSIDPTVVFFLALIIISK